MINTLVVSKTRKIHKNNFHADTTSGSTTFLYHAAGKQLTSTVKLKFQSLLNMINHVLSYIAFETRLPDVVLAKNHRILASLGFKPK